MNFFLSYDQGATQLRRWKIQRQTAERIGSVLLASAE